MARTVLLADDSVTAQNMGRRILVDAGYEVITVNNGSSALKKITEVKPDLIVLDVYMPGYGGLEVCQRIREVPETARIPVLLTVGKLEPFKADEARRVRADAFIVKPFEASELLTALTNLEDRIVAQPIGPQRGPLNVPEDPVKDFGDKDRGWRSRLRIPSRGKTREAEAAPEPAPANSEEFYEVKLRGAESTQPPPAEINAASTRESETEPRNGQGLALEQKPPQPVNGEEKARDAVADRPHGERKPVEDEVAAVLATIPDSAKGSTPAPTGPRWIAEPVAVTKDESALVLEQEMEKAAATSTAAAVEATRSIPSHYGIPSSPAESSMPTPVEGSMPPAAEGSAPPPTESSTPPEAKSPSPPEPPVPSPDTIKPQEGRAVAAASAEAAGATAAPQPQSSEVLAKEVQAYAAQASAGAAPETQGVTEAAASSQASLTTDPRAAVVESSEVSAAAVEHLLAGSVTSPELTAEMAATAQSSVPSAAPGEGSSAAATEAGTGDGGEAIARAVDKLLAELKPKLIEELAKKMKKDDK
ncbi:MAG TPA: response regulator [Terriglobales bacterium]|nr:response regulator [Terriglobales bacterium]